MAFLGGGKPSPQKQAENMSVCDLKFGSEIYLEIGLWKFGKPRLQRRV
jgi:hypothetical protein